MIRLLILVAFCGTLAAEPLLSSAPEREGVSPERLKRIHSMIQGMVDSGQRSGAISMVVRNGKIVDVRTYGYRDIERKLPMERDTICGIASMSKTITSAAAMMLHEEGKFELTDPIARYIPELKELKVFTEERRNLRNWRNRSDRRRSGIC